MSDFEKFDNQKVEITQKEYFNFMAHKITHDVVEQVDKKIDVLDKRIDKLDNKIDTVAKDLDNKIDTVAKDLDNKINTVAKEFHSELKNTKKEMINTMKWGFGLAIVILGAIHFFH